jgi:hypothetical protein
VIDLFPRLICLLSGSPKSRSQFIKKNCEFGFLGGYGPRAEFPNSFEAELDCFAIFLGSPVSLWSPVSGGHEIYYPGVRYDHLSAMFHGVRDL